MVSTGFSWLKAGNTARDLRVLLKTENWLTIGATVSFATRILLYGSKEVKFSLCFLMKACGGVDV
jgi:hypothetical protein